MRCERCGGEIKNKITRVNGVTICERCARELGISMAFGSTISSAFPILDELTNAIMSSGSDIEFTTSKITCPRCGTSLREYESSNKVGCIECYNFFNDSIKKSMLKRQGSSEYTGRKPGEATEIMFSEVQDKEESIQPEIIEKTADNKETEQSESPVSKTKKSMYEKLLKADLGMVPDDDLMEAMKQAASAEDYVFAAKIRDELKSRKGGEI